ncbi:hypothetical protein SEA_RIBEYE_62 [Gordonia phage Ribeye]|nr:hypothetical protein J1768_gp62 [Gordonia phage Ribeye]AXH44925.1 hypothetical protein SEA_RIBEYE_62 [Gordonia phage Ribeye]
MKVRGRHRPRRARITVYDSEFRAVWPQPKLDQPTELASFLNGIAHMINTGRTP